MTAPTWQRQVMRRVGLVLMLVGVADIAACGFAVANRMSYGSSLNVFVLIAGVGVYRGNVGAIRWVVRWLSFMLGGFLLLPVLTAVLSFVLPSLMGGTRSSTRALFGAVSGVALIALLFWVRQSLARLPVFAGNRPAPPFLRTPETYAGAAIPIILGAAFIIFFKMGVLN
jgi:hypothetical protein